MKKSLYGIVLFSLIVFASCSQTRNIQDESYVNEPSNAISYQQFYDDLSPYGEWIDNPEFGYVWAPHLNNFRPYYSNGYWTYTNYGWTWVSNYDWGWAPFHYGRWLYDDFNGWVWVPGNEWAPAWVTWRSNSEYYGWAPMCPTGRDGRYYGVRNDQWAFVPHQYINRRNINNYYINQQNNTTIINNTTEINKVRVINNNTKYQQGPSVTDVENETRTKIRPLQVKQSSVPGTRLQNGALQIYKPVVKQTTGDNIRPPKIVETRTRSLSPAASQPAIETPQTNNNTQNNNTDTRTKQADNNRNFPKPAVVSPNNNRVVVTPPVNNTPPNNTQPSVQEDRKVVRQFPTQQDQPNSVPRAGKIIVPGNDNNDNNVPQQSRPNIIVPERRTVVTPQQSPKVYQRERMVNQERQQAPVVNPRPVRQAPVFNPPSNNTFERRTQVAPNNPVQVPARVNNREEDRKK